MKYFTLPELTFSREAQRLGLDNAPTPAQLRNLVLLTDKVLDPARELWGQPIVVTSGFRSSHLNELVGGVPNSQHLAGLAADIVTLGADRMRNYMLFMKIARSEIPFDQLIAEKHKDGHCAWVHISYSNTPRHQVIYR